MKHDDIYKYEPLFESWQIDEKIGEGSFGVVYKVSKRDMGEVYDSAVKVISVPTKEQYHEAESSLGDDEKTLTEYFEDIVKNIVKEIKLLYSLSGNANIIGYQDHKVIKKEKEIRWDILIRMEYVTSLRRYLKEHAMTKEEVVRLGIDICTALETCSKKGIVHRDIKDENIFVSEDGVFKLGDFGIARELSKSGRAASMRGTPLYMAPEIYRGEKYDAAVDIYSLGIVLYKLLNNGRMPFMPPYPEKVRYQDSEDALEKRMSGASLPPPDMAREALGNVVLKACAYRATERYASSTVMKRELESALAGMSEAERSQVVLAPAEKQADTAESKTDHIDRQPEPASTGTEGTLGMFPAGMNTAAQAQAEAGIGSTIGMFPERQTIDRTLGILELKDQYKNHTDNQRDAWRKADNKRFNRKANSEKTNRLIRILKMLIALIIPLILAIVYFRFLNNYNIQSNYYTWVDDWDMTYHTCIYEVIIPTFLLSLFALFFSFTKKRYGILISSIFNGLLLLYGLFILFSYVDNDSIQFLDGGEWIVTYYLGLDYILVTSLCLLNAILSVLLIKFQNAITNRKTKPRNIYMVFTILSFVFISAISILWLIRTNERSYFPTAGIDNMISIVLLVFGFYLLITKIIYYKKNEKWAFMSLFSGVGLGVLGFLMKAGRWIIYGTGEIPDAYGWMGVPVIVFGLTFCLIGAVIKVKKAKANRENGQNQEKIGEGGYSRLNP